MSAASAPQLPRRRKSTGRLGRPPAADGAETRRQLIEVARQHFAQNGYSDATLKDIASSLGVTTGAVYYYYPSKTDLFIAVADDMMTRWQELMEEQVDRDAPFRLQLRDTLEVIAMLNVRHPMISSFILTLDLEGQRHPELQDVRLRSLALRDGFFRDLIDRAAERHEFGPGVSVDSVEDFVATLRLGMARFGAVTTSMRRHRSMMAALTALLDGQLFSVPSRI